MPATPPEIEIYECANCGHRDAPDKLPAAKDVSQRCEAGDEFSDKECPHCGALCFPLGDEGTTLLKAAAPRLLSALTACELQLREYVAWHHKHSGGCSVEIESAWEEARDAMAAARGPSTVVARP